MATSQCCQCSWNPGVPPGLGGGGWVASLPGSETPWTPLWIRVPHRRDFSRSQGLWNQGRAGRWLLMNQTAPLGRCATHTATPSSECFCTWGLVLGVGPGWRGSACIASSLRGPLRASLSLAPSRHGIGMPTGEGLGPLDIARPPPPPLQREPGAGGLEGSRIAAQGFCHSPGTPVLLCKAFLPALLPSGDLTSCVMVTVSQLGTQAQRAHPRIAQSRPSACPCAGLKTPLFAGIKSAALGGHHSEAPWPESSWISSLGSSTRLHGEAAGVS